MSVAPLANNDDSFRARARYESSSPDRDEFTPASPNVEGATRIHLLLPRARGALARVRHRRPCQRALLPLALLRARAIPETVGAVLSFLRRLHGVQRRSRSDASELSSIAEALLTRIHARCCARTVFVSSQRPPLSLSSLGVIAQFAGRTLAVLATSPLSPDQAQAILEKSGETQTPQLLPQRVAQLL
jgi:hypothetical protein